MQKLLFLAQQKIGLYEARKAWNKGAIKETDIQWKSQHISREVVLKDTEHFAIRVAQRFRSDEEDMLALAISRAVRSTKPAENGRYHSAVTQRYEDAQTGIVVVLERYGTYGATLVTTYKKGCENLLSDEEYADLKARGVL